MAEINPQLREELVQLGQELYEGDITRKGYDKRLTQLLSRYNVVPGEAYPGNTSTADIEAAHTFPRTTGNSGVDAETEAQGSHLLPNVCEPIINSAELPSHSTLSHRLSASKFSSFSSKHPPNALIRVLARTEAFIREWTPFLLVSSYFIFSTCLYMLCNGELVSIFWFIYLISNFYIAGSTVRCSMTKTSPCG